MYATAAAMLGTVRPTWSAPTRFSSPFATPPHAPPAPASGTTAAPATIAALFFRKSLRSPRKASLTSLTLSRQVGRAARSLSRRGANVDPFLDLCDVRLRGASTSAVGAAGDPGGRRALPRSLRRPRVPDRRRAPR